MFSPSNSRVDFQQEELLYFFIYSLLDIALKRLRKIRQSMLQDSIKGQKRPQINYTWPIYT